MYGFLGLVVQNVVGFYIAVADAVGVKTQDHFEQLFDDGAELGLRQRWEFP
jgi:hypothetical protein